MRIAILVLLTAVAMTAQTSRTLRQKYGEPSSETKNGRTTSETYNVRLDIKVTATYAKSGDLCEMLIAPLSETKDGKPSLLKSEPLNEVIDELVPEAQRGKHLMDTFLNITCLPKNDCFGVDRNYQRLTIHVHGSSDAHPYASIQWKHQICVNG